MAAALLGLVRTVDVALAAKRARRTEAPAAFDDGGEDDVSAAEALRPMLYQSSMAFGFDVELEFPRYQMRWVLPRVPGDVPDFLYLSDVSRLNPCNGQRLPARRNSMRRRAMERRAVINQILAEARSGGNPPELALLPRLPPMPPPGEGGLTPCFDLFEGERKCLHRVVRFFTFPNGLPQNVPRDLAKRLPQGFAGVEVGRTGHVRFNQRFFLRAACSEAPLAFRARSRGPEESPGAATEEDAYFEVLLLRVPKPRDDRTRPVNITIGAAARPFLPYYAPGTVPLSFGVSITPGHKIRITACTGAAGLSAAGNPPVVEVKLPKLKQPGAVLCGEGDTVGILLKRTSEAMPDGRTERGMRLYVLVNGSPLAVPQQREVRSGSYGRSGSFSALPSAAAAARAAATASPPPGRDPHDFMPAFGAQASVRFLAASAAQLPPPPEGSPEREKNLVFETPGLHAVVCAGGPCELLVNLSARVPPGMPGYDRAYRTGSAATDDEFGLGRFGLAALPSELAGEALPGFAAGARPPSYRSGRESEDVRRSAEGRVPEGPPPAYHV
ncbi:hypothetical protein DFJ74DRAFT_665060 [Hyaloraphidium curvatum]|nr:hypothetical protein DFJ74DRAFT_665060 [Hyaloraphidium curvatum]